MKKTLSAMILTSFFLFAAAKASDDCSKSSDACRKPVKTVSPFMAEVQKAEKVLEIKQGKSRPAELKTPAPVEASSAPASGAGAAAAEKKDVFSKPAWLLAVSALLAGLYYFLKEGKKRGKKT